MLGLRRPRRRRVVAGILVGCLVVAGIAGARTGIFARDRAQPASVQDALSRFRQGDRATRSLEGVYRVTTTGFETLDVLGGARHRYPATTTITARRTACGLRIDWQALQERTTAWQLCSTAAGIELASTSERHRFFWSSDTTSYSCTGALLLPAAEADIDPARPRAFTCTNRGARKSGRAVSLGRMTLRIGSTSVEAEHVRTTTVVSGDSQGRETTDWWLDTRTGLPVRVSLDSRTSRKTIVGTAHYTESAELQLASLVPSR